MPTFITAQDEHGPITARSADDTSVILDWEIPSTFIPCSVCGYNIDWLEFKQTITIHKNVLHNWWQQQEHWWHHNTKKNYYQPKHKYCKE